MAPDRATGIILKGDQILLIYHKEPSGECYIIPGGRVEAGEIPEQAVEREIKEETCLDVTRSDFIFSVAEELESGSRTNYYYYCEVADGVPEIGGPEKESMSETNYFEPRWFPISQMDTSPIIISVTESAKPKIKSFLDSHQIKYNL